MKTLTNRALNLAQVQGASYADMRIVRRRTQDITVKNGVVEGLSDNEMAYMVHWLRNEGNVALLDHMEAEGIDPRDKPVEFRSYHYELFPRGGVYYDETGKTSLKGLYAAGDEIFGGISGAAVFGWIAGENAGHRAKDIEMASIKLSPMRTNPDLYHATVQFVPELFAQALWQLMSPEKKELLGNRKEVALIRRKTAKITTR